MLLLSWATSAARAHAQAAPPDLGARAPGGAAASGGTVGPAVGPGAEIRVLHELGFALGVMEWEADWTQGLGSADAAPAAAAAAAAARPERVVGEEGGGGPAATAERVAASGAGAAVGQQLEGGAAVLATVLDLQSLLAPLRAAASTAGGGPAMHGTHAQAQTAPPAAAGSAEAAPVGAARAEAQAGPPAAAGEEAGGGWTTAPGPGPIAEGQPDAAQAGSASHQPSAEQESGVAGAADEGTGAGPLHPPQGVLPESASPEEVVAAIRRGYGFGVELASAEEAARVKVRARMRAWGQHTSSATRIVRSERPRAFETAVPPQRTPALLGAAAK